LFVIFHVIVFFLKIEILSLFVWFLIGPLIYKGLYHLFYQSPIQLKKGNYCGKVQTALCPFQLPPVQFLLNSSLQFFTFCTFCIFQCRFKFQISSLSLFFALYIIVYVLFIYSSSFSSLLLSVFFFLLHISIFLHIYLLILYLFYFQDATISMITMFFKFILHLH
jgi:hypothetical protein